MRILTAAVCGFVLDLIVGDPPCLTSVHPVVLMGHCISFLEKLLRKWFPKTPRGERAAGTVLSVILPCSVLFLCAALLHLLNRLWPTAAFVLELIWCWQALAVKNLRDEAMRVFRALQNGSLEDARRAVSRIVGRDTDTLSRTQVCCAAIETVAENFSDGIAAPLFYMLLGGAPLALCYKAVNTMDSMLGYKTPRYRWFGRAAAKLDDAANYLPSRIAALFLIAVAAPCGQSTHGAFRIWRRDRRMHESPNSGQCEAAVAGALGVRLCGPASYFGELHNKPFIGDDIRSAVPEDIRRTCRMEAAGSVLALFCFSLVRFLFLQVI